MKGPGSRAHVPRTGGPARKALEAQDSSMSNLHPVFQQASVLQGLEEEARRTIASAFRAFHYDEGTTLFLEGEPARVFYLIGEGRVKVLQTSPEGHQVILHMLGPGQLVGALPTLEEGNYPATAVTMEKSLLFSIAAKDFEAILEEYPQVTRNLLRFATQKLHETHAKLREMATERVEQRIARLLCRLVGQVGVAVEGGILLDLPLTRQDLAEMTGTTLYTVSRTLKNWERRGLLRSQRTRVIIINQHALALLAEDLAADAVS